MNLLEQLRAAYAYDPDLGWFIQREGQPRPYFSGKYWFLSFAGESTTLHRWIWFYVYGKWPIEVDHIDGDTNNHKLANLREVTTRQNGTNQKKRNNNSGFRGVSWCSRDKIFRAQIRDIAGKKVSLGDFKSAELASLAYERALESKCALLGIQYIKR